MYLSWWDSEYRSALLPLNKSQLGDRAFHLRHWQSGPSMEVTAVPTTMMVRTYSCESHPHSLTSVTVSLVDGFNIPISITNDKNCPPAECAADLGATCKLIFYT